MSSILVLSNARLATMHEGRSSAQSPGPLGIVLDGAVAIDGDRILFAGPQSALPQAWRKLTSIDLGGRWVTPGLIDCHTHLVYAGDRAHEWQRRLEGESYASIAAQGGGIVASVTATRTATEEELIDGAANRLADWLAEGITTVEIKSGYGLSVSDELKMLRAARQLGERLPIRVRTTFLGAHATPPEYRGRNEAYIDLVIDAMLPAVAAERLADAVDVFCEHLAFSAQQSERLMSRAKALGLAVKVHADQLSDSGGSLLAARHHALSADHLEYTPESSIQAMAKAKVVAVLLPAAFYCMRETQMPPIAAMRDAGIAMAIATDHNPGTSPCSSLLLVLNMACTLFRMTTAEALLGVTRHAAQALGLQHEIGQLREGYCADLAIWDVDHVRQLCYGFGRRPLAASMYRGQWVKGLTQPR